MSFLCSNHLLKLARSSDLLVAVLPARELLDRTVQLQQETVALRAAAVQTALLFYRDQLRLELQTQAHRRTELDRLLHFDKGAELRAPVADEQPSVFEEQGAVVAADADLLHDHCAVAVPADGDLVLSQSDEEDGEAFVVGVVLLDAFEDGVGGTGCVFEVEEQVLASLEVEFGLVELLAEFALGFLVGVEERVVVFAFDDVVGDPVAQAFEVGVLH